MVCGRISVHGMGDLYMCEGTIVAKVFIRILETYGPIKTSFL